MRISAITPKFFGKYKHDQSLKLQDSSMIVVYGQNETGKSTFVDCAVTLLSAKYDSSLLSAYGEPGTVLSGEVSLTENGEALNISFKPEAKIPERTTEVKRVAKPAKSDLWKKIQNLESGIIRNLYRVNSIEIADGEKTKEKLKQYELGDKRGVSIPGKIDAYRTRLRKYEHAIEEYRVKILELNSTKSEVTRTSDDYRKIKSRIDEIEKAISDCRNELSKVHAKLAGIGFCRGSKTVADEAQSAKKALTNCEKEGVLVPREFAQYATLISEIIRSVGSLDSDLGESEKREATSSLRELEEAIESESLALTGRKDFMQSHSNLFNQEYLSDILQKIRNEIAQRDALLDSVNLSTLQDKQTELDIAVQQAEIEKENWSKFSDNRTAQQFSVSSDAVMLEIDIKSGIKQLNFLAILAVVAAIPILIRGERFGAIALIALAVGLFFLARGSALKPKAATSEGGNQKKECAGRVITADDLVITRRKDLTDLSERKSGLEGQHQEKLKTIEGLITELGLKEKSTISSKAFGAIEDRVRKIVETSSLLEGRKTLCAISIAKNKDQNVEFDAQKKHLVSTLKHLGESISGDEFNSRDVLIGLANDRLERFEEQNLWRKSISEWDVSLAREKNLEIINELRSLDEEGWTNEEKKLEERKNNADVDIETKNSELFKAQSHKKELETRQQLPQLNLEISVIENELRESHMNILRLTLQIEMVEKFAKMRAEHTKPKLHKSIQGMVLAVADKWKSVNFSEGDLNDSSIVITIEYEDGSIVGDKSLSVGARSLLFLAIRVAIMKQEAESISKFNFPLLCDDPLLPLDDVRTKQAFEMLKKESEGHQIIYFTCKEEIRDLALSSGVPVVVIS